MSAADISTHGGRQAAYQSADGADRSYFAESRTNILLVGGDHYSKRQTAASVRARDGMVQPGAAPDQKLRLVKNHTQRIHKRYSENVLSASPGVGFSPRNENELQDQKAAELHKSVYFSLSEKMGLEEDEEDNVDSFITTAELHSEITYDYTKGEVVGYEQAVDADGNEQFGEDGEPLPDENKPVRRGAFVENIIPSYNLLRHPSAKSIKKSPWLCVREMVSVRDLQRRFPGAAAKIKPTADGTYMVFDSIRGGYRESDANECLVQRWFVRPCEEYPNGKYYIDIENEQLDEGELPGGVFPIVSEIIDKLDSSPRGVSIIRTIRPFQVEINRAGSKMAEHQTTMGDDKIVTTDGADLTQGATLSGIRQLKTNGGTPLLIEGRNGAQYQPYSDSIREELYEVTEIGKLDEDKVTNVDPYSLLFKAAAEKKKYARYIRKYQMFKTNRAKLILKLAKIYLPDDEVIRMVGRPEQVNISEFKNANDLDYEIKIEAQSEDTETKLGKQLAINHILQYAGPKLQPEDIGKLARLMPYGNVGEGLADMTLNYDDGTNVILALDRGEDPVMGMFDDDVYISKRLVNRMRKADFKYLAPNIQANYQKALQLHQRAVVAKQAQIQRAQAGFIPTSGYLVSCDFYAKDPANPANSKRVRIPSDALTWLIKGMSDQGVTLDQLESMNKGSAAQIAEMLTRSQNGGRGNVITLPPGGYRPTAVLPSGPSAQGQSPTPAGAPPQPPSSGMRAEQQRGGM